MPEDRDHRRSGAGIALFAILVMLLVFPVLYVLSCGPAVALMTRGYLSEDAFEVAYYPLSAAANNSDWIGQPLEWYADLWAAPQTPPSPASVTTPNPAPAPYTPPPPSPQPDP